MAILKLSPDDKEDLKEFLNLILDKYGVVPTRDLVSDTMSFSISICAAIEVIDNLTKTQDEFDDAVTQTVLINFLKLCSTHRPLLKYLLYLSHRYGDVVKGIDDANTDL